LRGAGLRPLASLLWLEPEAGGECGDQWVPCGLDGERVAERGAVEVADLPGDHREVGEVARPARRAAVADLEDRADLLGDLLRPGKELDSERGGTCNSRRAQVRNHPVAAFAPLFTRSTLVHRSPVRPC
jgi:hypothetical protein